MITEDYVGFETAKLLKDKGFDWDESPFYSEQDRDEWRQNNSYSVPNEEYNPNLPFDTETLTKVAPHVSIQMVMKWLREVHHLFIGVEPRLSFTDYYWITANVYRVRKKNSLYHAEPVYDYSCVACCDGDSFEGACKSAIKYALEKLI